MNKKKDALPHLAEALAEVVHEPPPTGDWGQHDPTEQSGPSAIASMYVVEDGPTVAAPLHNTDVTELHGNIAHVVGFLWNTRYVSAAAHEVQTFWDVYGKEAVKGVPGFRKMTFGEIASALGK